MAPVAAQRVSTRPTAVQHYYLPEQPPQVMVASNAGKARAANQRKLLHELARLPTEGHDVLRGIESIQGAARGLRAQFGAHKYAGTWNKERAGRR